jgi:hypothetical protein
LALIGARSESCWQPAWRASASSSASRRAPTPLPRRAGRHTAGDDLALGRRDDAEADDLAAQFIGAAGLWRVVGTRVVDRQVRPFARCPIGRRIVDPEPRRDPPLAVLEQIEVEQSHLS